MNIWFTSDEHYNHFNIIKYTNRPFSSVEEMNEILIENHNFLVKDKDEVYHLGDFSFNNPNQYLKRLNGKHYLILGNHDSKQDKECFGWVKDVYLLKNILTNFHIFLSHYSHRVWPQMHYGTAHLFGHSHNTLEPYGRSFDCGVDTNKFFPYHLDEVIQKFKSLTPIVLFGNDPLKKG